MKPLPGNGPVPAPRRGRIPAALGVAGIVLLTTAAYGSLFSNEFVNFDDNLYVTENRRVLGGLTASGLRWAFTTTHASNWHPLTWISLMLDVELFGARPAAIHGVNLLLHIASALLIFELLRRVSGRPAVAWLTAAWFAVHPLHVESVAWAAERKDVLSTLFLWLVLAAYSSYARTRRRRWYLLALACLALGLLAKPMLVTVPVLLFLWDAWPLGRTGPLRRSLWEKAPFLALALASGLATLVAQSSGMAMGTVEVLPLVERWINASLRVWHYLWKTLWPSGLAVFYPHPGRGLPVWQGVAATAAIVALTVVVARLRRRLPECLSGWLWYLITLAPVLGLVQVGSQSMADRYTYVPLTGVLWAAAFGLTRLPGRVAWATGGAVTLLLVLLTIRQVGVWRSSETLFRHALEHTERNYLAHHNLGVALAREGRLEEARAQYEKALSISPGYFFSLVAYGAELVKQGRLSLAEKHLERALKILPDNPDALCNLGICRGMQGRYQEAVELLEQAVRAAPHRNELRDNLAIARARAAGRDPDGS